MADGASAIVGTSYRTHGFDPQHAFGSGGSNPRSGPAADKTRPIADTRAGPLVPDPKKDLAVVKVDPAVLDDTLERVSISQPAAQDSNIRGTIGVS